ncbi:DUF1648 domain-containing protein [Chloroflexota bacterium]
MWQKLNKCYPPQFELIPLLLLVLTFYVALSNYLALPDTIPIDFNIRGIPDEWVNKNLIFLYPGLSTFIYLLFTSINIWFAVTKDPKSLINLPTKWKASLSDLQTEKLRVVLNRCLFIMKVLVQSLSTYLLYISIEIALGRASNLGTLFALLILAIFTITGLMVWRSLQIVRATVPPYSQID